MIETVCHFALLFLSHMFGQVLLLLSLTLSLCLFPLHIFCPFCACSGLGCWDFFLLIVDLGFPDPVQITVGAEIGNRQTDWSGVVGHIFLRESGGAVPFCSDGVLSFNKRPNKVFASRSQSEAFHKGKPHRNVS